MVLAAKENIKARGTPCGLSTAIYPIKNRIMILSLKKVDCRCFLLFLEE